MTGEALLLIALLAALAGGAATIGGCALVLGLTARSLREAVAREGFVVAGLCLVVVVAALAVAAQIARAP